MIPGEISSWFPKESLDEDGIPVVVLAKKSAFTAEEEENVRSHLRSNPGLMALLPSF